MVTTHIARIGPNAIIQTINALRERYGLEASADLLRRGGHPDLLDRLPDDMVDEQEFIDLEHTLLDLLGEQDARAVLFRAGELTAGYLLKHRIPLPIQRLLKVLPRGARMRLLTLAIARHAWTFVGSGQFGFALGPHPMFTIERCPACRGVHTIVPFCSFYTGCFETLLRALIQRRVSVREVACGACGGACCTFAIDFR